MLHSIILNEQEREENMRNYLLESDVLQQIICTIKIRRAPTRHDNIDFRPIITKTSEILPLSVVTVTRLMIVKRTMFWLENYYMGSA